MAQEKELKIKLQNISLSDFIHLLNPKGYKRAATINQLDIYYDTTDWLLYKNMAALRLRQVNGQDFSFSFKKVFYFSERKEPYYIEEIEIKSPFADSAAFLEIFNRLKVKTTQLTYSSGLEITQSLKEQQFFDEQKMEKQRQTFIKGANEIIIDTIAGVGTIIEIECKGEDEPLDIASTILKPTQWQRSTEGTSYLWLEKIKGLTLHHSYEMKKIFIKILQPETIRKSVLTYLAKLNVDNMDSVICLFFSVGPAVYKLNIPLREGNSI